MPLKIAFIGYSQRLTRQHFEEFAWDNREQIRRADYIKGRIELRDGTIIIRMDAHKVRRDGYRFDQIIVADDRRGYVYSARYDDIRWLVCTCSCSIVPQEFRMLFYDVDAPREE